MWPWKNTNEIFFFFSSSCKSKTHIIINFSVTWIAFIELELICKMKPCRDRSKNSFAFNGLKTSINLLLFYFSFLLWTDIACLNTSSIGNLREKYEKSKNVIWINGETIQFTDINRKRPLSLSLSLIVSPSCFVVWHFIWIL